MLRTVEVSARLEGSRDELFAIVADLPSYSRWLPGVERSSVLAREGDVAVAELRASRWSDRTFNLELIQSPPGAVAFRQIDSLDRPEISGRWQIGETTPGVGASTAEVLLRLRLETPLFATFARRRMRAALRAGLDALGARRRHLSVARPASAAGRLKVLEVVREADGLKVWYLGDSFRMPKAGGP